MAAYCGSWLAVERREVDPERWIWPYPPAPAPACVGDGACSWGGRGGYSMDPPPPEAADAGSSCCGEEMCAERSETVGDGGIWIWGERWGLGLGFCGVETEAAAASWSGCAGDAEAATGGGSAMAGL
jgi:hypothetical protein